MNIRHLATKYNDGSIDYSKSVIIDGSPVIIPTLYNSIDSGFGNETYKLKYLEENKVLKSCKNRLLQSPLGGILLGNGTFSGESNTSNKDIISLSRLFDFTVDTEDSGLPKGISFMDIISDENVSGVLIDCAKQMFSGKNPNTNDDDVDEYMYYTKYIPLVIYTGSLLPQIKNNEYYFNPNGVVTLAEFLDGLNSIKYGISANIERKQALDNISTEEDYFNTGYNSCCWGISSPFFYLYRREELLRPITLIEMAYIVVMCWEPFLDKFNSPSTNIYDLGFTFNWLNSGSVLSQFNDKDNYKLSSISNDNVISLDIKDYKSDLTMESYIDLLVKGKKAIPLPMFMSLVELYNIGFLNKEMHSLSPLKELSRGDFCYFLVMLANTFKLNYKGE